MIAGSNRCFLFPLEQLYSYSLNYLSRIRFLERKELFSSVNVVTIA